MLSKVAAQSESMLCEQIARQNSCTWGAGALEQESWSAVQVPGDSQQLIEDWAERAVQLKAASVSPAKKPSAQSNGANLLPGKHSSSASQSTALAARDGIMCSTALWTAPYVCFVVPMVYA